MRRENLPDWAHDKITWKCRDRHNNVTLRRGGDVLMGRCCYVLLRSRHDVPIRHHWVFISRWDIPLRHLGDVPTRRHWVFHLGRTCDVAGTYKETLLRRCHDVLLPSGQFICCKSCSNLSLLISFVVSIVFRFFI